jgi:citrate synthase
MSWRRDSVADDRSRRRLVPLRSGIAYINGQAGELLYRGHNIHDIAERLSFEETVFLLWQGRLPAMDEARAFADELATYRAVPDAILELIRITPEYAHPMAALRTAVSMLACVDPDQDEPGREGHELKAKKMLVQLPTIVTAQHRIAQVLEPIAPDPELSHAANYLYMLSGRLPEPASVQALSVFLNLYAEHELVTSTYTARVVMTRRSDFYSAIVAAISALKGPLQDASGIDAVMRMLLRAGAAEGAAGAVEDELAMHGRLPGFGSRMYAAEDPRAAHLRHALQELTHGRSQWGVLAEAVARCAEAQAQLRPNIDLYGAPVLYQLGFPVELFMNVVASARVAGWAAHALEQYEDDRPEPLREDYVRPRTPG